MKGMTGQPRNDTDETQCSLCTYSGPDTQLTTHGVRACGACRTNKDLRVADERVTLNLIFSNKDLENGLFILGETICDECNCLAIGYTDPVDDEYFGAHCAEHIMRLPLLIADILLGKQEK